MLASRSNHASHSTVACCPSDATEASSTLIKREGDTKRHLAERAFRDARVSAWTGGAEVEWRGAPMASESPWRERRRCLCLSPSVSLSLSASLAPFRLAAIRFLLLRYGTVQYGAVQWRTVQCSTDSVRLGAARRSPPPIFHSARFSSPLLSSALLCTRPPLSS